MASWLELTNTLINLQTMSRVGEVAQGQAQLTAQVAQNQRDNTLLTSLVDTYVKVRELVQDQRFFDAMISSGYGITIFKQIYPQIVAAETKLKAADLEIKFIDTIREALQNQAIKTRAQEAYKNIILEFQQSLQNDTETMKKTQYRVLPLKDPKLDIELEVGDTVVPLQDIPPKMNIVLYAKGKPYPVVRLNAAYKRGFVVVSEQGQAVILYKGSSSGWWELFAVVHPTLPLNDQMMFAWSQIERFFTSEFLDQNLKSCRDGIAEIRKVAYMSAGLAESDIENMLHELNELRQKKVREGTKPTITATRTSSVTRRQWLLIGISIIVSILIVLVGLIPALRILNGGSGGSQPNIAAIPTNGLVAYYPFNGNADDMSGNGNNGILENVVTTPDRFGYPNSAIIFSGVTTRSRMRVNNSPSLQFKNTFSLSLWVRMDAINGQNNGLDQMVSCVFAKMHDNPGMIGMISYQQSQFFGSLIINGFASPSIVLSTSLSGFKIGRWTHLVYVAEPNSLALYVSGHCEQVQVGVVDLTIANQQDLYFGAYGTRDAGQSIFYTLTGCLDDIRIYNRALTTDEITALYNER